MPTDREYDLTIAGLDMNGHGPQVRPNPAGTKETTMATEALDDRMDRFYRETRVWPPGRDMPASMCGGGYPDAHAIWRLWCSHENLLAALERCEDVLGAWLYEANSTGASDALAQARAAIARARGEEVRNES